MKTINPKLKLCFGIFVSIVCPDVGHNLVYTQEWFTQYAVPGTAGKLELDVVLLMVLETARKFLWFTD